MFVMERNERKGIYYMLIKKKNNLLEQLHNLTIIVHEAAHYFSGIHKQTDQNLKQFYDTMKGMERKADKIISQLIHDLNAQFITPLEREDMLNLALKIDDILDGMETCVSHFYMYGLEEIDEVMIKFGKNIELNMDAILKSIELLVDKKFPAIREHTIYINQLESEADLLLRESIRNLFKTSTDPLFIMRYKEMYDILEEVTDSCEDVADVLEFIIMRNS